MDIHCRFCGEPWDLCELHDMEGRNGAVGFGEAAKRFKRLGCAAWDGMWTLAKPCKHDVFDAEMASFAAASQEESDEPDEWA